MLPQPTYSYLQPALTMIERAAPEVPWNPNGVQSSDAQNSPSAPYPFLRGDSVGDTYGLHDVPQMNNLLQGRSGGPICDNRPQEIERIPDGHWLYQGMQMPYPQPAPPTSWTSTQDEYLAQLSSGSIQQVSSRRFQQPADHNVSPLARQAGNADGRLHFEHQAIISNSSLLQSTIKSPQYQDLPNDGHPAYGTHLSWGPAEAEILNTCAMGREANALHESLNSPSEAHDQIQSHGGNVTAPRPRNLSSSHLSFCSSDIVSDQDPLPDRPPRSSLTNFDLHTGNTIPERPGKRLQSEEEKRHTLEIRRAGACAKCRKAHIRVCRL